MLVKLAQIRKAIEAGVMAGSAVYATLAQVSGLNPWVQLGGAVGAGFVAGWIVWRTPNAPAPAAAGTVPGSGVKPSP